MTGLITTCSFVASGCVLLVHYDMPLFVWGPMLISVAGLLGLWARTLDL